MQVNTFNQLYLSRLFLLVLCLSVTISASAQKCKYSKNEVDDMTGSSTTTMKEQRIYKKLKMFGPESVKVYLRSVQGTNYLNITSYLQTDAYSIDDGETVIIKFVDGSTIRLRNFNAQTADYKQLGMSGSSTQWYATHKIVLSDDDFDLLKLKPIEKIRLYMTDGYLDFDIKKKNSKVLQHQCKCIEKQL